MFKLSKVLSITNSVLWVGQRWAASPPIPMAIIAKDTMGCDVVLLNQIGPRIILNAVLQTGNSN